MSDQHETATSIQSRKS